MVSEPEARPVRRRVPDRLIQGEDPETRHALDARHWLNIYAELVAFHEDLLQRFRGEAAHLDGAERKRLETGELAPLRAEIERLRGRLHLWQGRCLDLSGLELDHGARTLRYGAAEVRLTKRELQLVDVLLRHPGKRLRAEALIAMGWRESRLAPEQLRTYIGRLRRKLAESRMPVRIENHPRQGYALVFD